MPEPGDTLGRYVWSRPEIGAVEFIVIAKTADEGELAIGLRYWETNGEFAWANGTAGELGAELGLDWEAYIGRVNAAVRVEVPGKSCPKCHETRILGRRQDTRYADRGPCPRCRPQQAQDVPRTDSSRKKEKPTPPEPPTVVEIGDSLGRFVLDNSVEFELFALTTDREKLRWCLAYWATQPNGSWVTHNAESLSNRVHLSPREFVTQLSEATRVVNVREQCPHCNSALLIGSRGDIRSKLHGVCLRCIGCGSIAEARRAEDAAKEYEKRRRLQRLPKAVLMDLGEEMSSRIARLLPTDRQFWHQEGIEALSRELNATIDLASDLGLSEIGERVLGLCEAEARTIRVLREIVGEGLGTWTKVLAHELGHLVLHTELALERRGMRFHQDCAPNLEGTPTDDHEEEWADWQANAFALGFLMRRSAVVEAVVAVQKAMDITRNLGVVCVSPNRTSLQDFERILRSLCVAFGVGRADAYSRLKELEILHDEHFVGLRHISSLL